MVLFFLVMGFALPWVLPNHYYPWTSFHAEATYACMGWIAAGMLLFKKRSYIDIYPFTVLLMLCVSIPWFQFGFGIIPFFGQAWISSLYVAGLGLSITVGSAWSKQAPQEIETILLSSIIIAAVASVGLQYYVWLDLHGKGITDIWTMGIATDRPYANLGQPNLLASLLIWGILAGIWLYEKKHVNGIATTLLIVFLLTGIALTRSRTAQLTLTCLSLAVFTSKFHLRSKFAPYLGLSLLIFFFVMPSSFESLHSYLFFDFDLVSEKATEYIAPPQREVRLLAWQVFIKATALEPIWGFGWTDVAPAQLAVATHFPSLGEVFSSSHNLFIDLFLWTGYPLGLLISIFIIYSYWRILRHKHKTYDNILVLMLFSIGVHAMLEAPLQYAFFLIPSGIIFGTLLSRENNIAAWRCSFRYFSITWLFLGLALFATIDEYLNYEQRYYQQLFEKAQLNISTTYNPPDIVLLTQLESWLWAQRLKFDDKKSLAELSRLDALVRRHPSAPGILVLARQYALHGDLTASQYWLDRVCKFGERECPILRSRWLGEAEVNPALRKVVWPD